MDAPSVSLVLAVKDAAASVSDALVRISSGIQFSGLSYELVIVDDGSRDDTLRLVRQSALLDRRIRVFSDLGTATSAVRKGIQEARGDVVCVISLDLPYRYRELEYAIAMVHAGSTDVVIGTIDYHRSLIKRAGGVNGVRDRLVRRIAHVILGAGARVALSGLRVYSIHAAKLLYAESKLNGLALDFEHLYLASKYGFRVDFLPNAIASNEHLEDQCANFDLVRNAIRIIQFDRALAYRPPRRCPICFSANVRTADYVNGHLIRECRRCKCKYLSEFPTEGQMTRTRDLRLATQTRDDEEEERRIRARRKTHRKRMSELRRLLPRNARLFEVGAREGDLGLVLNQEFAYVGIELSATAARAARMKGLEVYCAALGDFVNLTGPYDAVVLFEVFQHLPNPHDALSRIKDNLKSGGLVVIVTPDTESLSSVLLGRRWSAYKVPEHVILYSRSALIELLEHSGFEIVSATSDYRYFAHQQVRNAVAEWPRWARRPIELALRLLPDPLIGSHGSIRVVAKRRSGVPFAARPVTSVEATHAQ